MPGQEEHKAPPMGTRDVHQSRLELCAYIRSPSEELKPHGQEARRLAIYERLFYKNLNRFVESAFPLLRGYYTDDRWVHLTRAFLREHRCQTPYFREISREFLLYLQDGYDYSNQDPPFMLELAHYEWAVLTLGFAPQEIPTDGIDPNGDLLSACPRLSPLLCSLHYTYPVHEVNAQAQPIEPEPNGVYLMLCRDREDQIRLLQGNIVTARLLAHVADGAMSGEQSLRAVVEELGRSDADAVVENGRQFLERLREMDMILGVRA